MARYCMLCNSGELAISSNEALKGVTSDSRPWAQHVSVVICQPCGHIQKELTPTYMATLDEIYRDYHPYKLSGTRDQSVFQGDMSISRAQKMLQAMRCDVLLANKGSLLDIGCGQGAFLQAFGELFVNWQLSGYDQDNRFKPSIKELPGVESFFCGPIEDVTGRFDLIAMHYVLEHIQTPIAFLKKIAALLKPGGRVIITVPDLSQNPFDIIVVDHCGHFLPATLKGCLERSGFEIDHVSTRWAARGITAMVGAAQAQGLSPSDHDGESSRAVAGRCHQWLAALHQQACEADNGQLGLFGTAPSSTWLAGVLGQRVKFFVDEDPARVGKEHLGRPVYHPADVAAGSCVYIALPFLLADAIFERQKEKYSKVNFIRPFQFQEECHEQN